MKRKNLVLLVEYLKTRALHSLVISDYLDSSDMLGHNDRLNKGEETEDQVVVCAAGVIITRGASLRDFFSLSSSD